MAASSVVLVPSATDYRPRETSASKYRFRMLVPEANQVVTMSASAPSNPIQFKIPGTYVTNLAETRLQFTLTTPAEPCIANTNAVPFVYANSAPLMMFRVETEKGRLLLDITDLQRYHRAVALESARFDGLKCRRAGVTYGQPIRTLVPQANAWEICPYDRDQTYIHAISLGAQGVAAGAAVVWGDAAEAKNTRWSLKTPAAVDPFFTAALAAKVALSDTPAIYNAYIGNIGIATAGCLTAGNTAGGGNAATCGIDFMHLPRESAMAGNLWQGFVQMKNTTACAQMVLRYDLPLSELLPHTFFQDDKDLFVNETLIFTISFQQTNRIGFYAETNGDMVATAESAVAAQTRALINATAQSAAGVAIVPVGGSRKGAFSESSITDHFLGATPFLTPATLTNPRLQICCEDNPEIAAAVRNETLTRGISYPVQSPLITTDTVAAASQYWSRIYKLNLSRGASLLRTYISFQIDAVAGGVHAAGVAGSGATTQLPTECNVMQGVFPVDPWPSALVPYTGTAMNTDARYDMSIMPSIWGSVRTFVNAVPTSDQALQPHDVFMRQRHLLKDSPLADELVWQATSAIIIDDYCQVDLARVTPSSGLSLVQPIDYMVEMNRANIPGVWPAAADEGLGYSGSSDGIPLTAVVIFICTRMLRTGPDGMTLEAI